MNMSLERVAVVCFSRSLGGLELSALHIAETMQAKGVPAILVVPPGSPLEVRALASGIETAGMMPHMKYFDLATAFKFYRVMRARRVGAVIIMRSQDINLASLAKVFLPSLRLAFYQQMRSGHNKRDWVHTWIYSKLSLWIALTEGMRDEAMACTRIPREKFGVVRLGTDMSRFDPAQFTVSEARAHFDLPWGKKIIGVIGRLDPQKGQEVLIRAIPAIVKDHPDVLFLIAGAETAGEPGYKKFLETLCAGMGVGQYVRFLEFTDDVPQLLAAMDVLVLPSFFETFGLIVIEAMAMEKPVIATNAGGVPEIVTDNETGLLIEPRDDAALAAAVRRVLDDPAFARSLAQRARAEAVRRYDFGTCVDALLEAVRAV